MSSTWQIHVFHLRAYGPNAVWVGVSYWSPEQRLHQHLTGIHASRTVRGGRPQLAPEHDDGLQIYYDRDEAEHAADDLVINLRADATRWEANCRLERRNRPRELLDLRMQSTSVRSAARPLAATAHRRMFLPCDQSATHEQTVSPPTRHTSRGAVGALNQLDPQRRSPAIQAGLRDNFMTYEGHFGDPTGTPE